MGERREEIEGFWYGRAFMYELAGVVFGGEPDESLVGVLSSGDCVAALEGLAGTCEGAGALAGFCTLVFPGRLPEMRSAYDRAILGLGERRSHPWESAYTSPRRLLMQVETLEVRNAYREFGYLPKLYPSVADDHVALECAFMAALAKRSVEALETGDEAGLRRLVDGQERFLHGHLLRWLGRYAEDLHEDAPGSLYALCADALVSLVEHDAIFLEDFCLRTATSE